MVSLGSPGIPQLDHNQEYEMKKVHLHLTETTDGHGGIRLTTQAQSQTQDLVPTGS